MTSFCTLIANAILWVHHLEWIIGSFLIGELKLISTQYLNHFLWMWVIPSIRWNDIFDYISSWTKNIRMFLYIANYYLKFILILKVLKIIFSNMNSLLFSVTVTSEIWPRESTNCPWLGGTNDWGKVRLPKWRWRQRLPWIWCHP